MHKLIKAIGCIERGIRSKEHKEIIEKLIQHGCKTASIHSLVKIRHALAYTGSEYIEEFKALFEKEFLDSVSLKHLTRFLLTPVTSKSYNTMFWKAMALQYVEDMASRHPELQHVMETVNVFKKL